MRAHVPGRTRTEEPNLTFRDINETYPLTSAGLGSRLQESELKGYVGKRLSILFESTGISLESRCFPNMVGI